ncbi:hypothetical protein [Ornithinimicrobium cryptoxanthini]|uniref:hypothetical protein n=1 Tax=Ornithinimicrobium cryptoxanthini TaxID=2934161 RepID=UPI00211810C4|nr:hypothetical protein [Ornithinimicrobium cryptoxanthini]
MMLGLAIIICLFALLAYVDQRNSQSRMLHLRTQPLVVLLGVTGARIGILLLASAVFFLPLALLGLLGLALQGDLGNQHFSVPTSGGAIIVELMKPVAVVSLAAAVAPMLWSEIMAMRTEARARQGRRWHSAINGTWVALISVYAWAASRLVVYRAPRWVNERPPWPKRSRPMRFAGSLGRLALGVYIFLGLIVAVALLIWPSIFSVELNSTEFMGGELDASWFLATAALTSVLAIDLLTWMRAMLASHLSRTLALLVTEVAVFFLLEQGMNAFYGWVNPAADAFVIGVMAGVTLAIYFDVGVALLAICIRLTDPALGGSFAKVVPAKTQGSSETAGAEL